MHIKYKYKINTRIVWVQNFYYFYYIYWIVHQLIRFIVQTDVILDKDWLSIQCNKGHLQKISLPIEFQFIFLQFLFQIKLRLRQAVAWLHFKRFFFSFKLNFIIFACKLKEISATTKKNQFKITSQTLQWNPELDFFSERSIFCRNRMNSTGVQQINCFWSCNDCIIRIDGLFELNGKLYRGKKKENI